MARPGGVVDDVPDATRAVRECPENRQTTDDERIRWMSTKEAAEHLGVTLRSLYRFIDEGAWSPSSSGGSSGSRQSDVDGFIEACRIAPGSLEHLYPEVKGSTAGARSHAKGLYGHDGRR